MNDNLDDLMRRAPRYQASDDFNQKVMERVSAPHAESDGSRRWISTAAAAVLIAVSLSGGVMFEKHRQAEVEAVRIEAARIDAIRAEVAALEKELRQLRMESERSSKVVFGGSDDKEYVMDLRDLTAPPREAQTVSQSF